VAHQLSFRQAQFENAVEYFALLSWGHATAATAATVATAATDTTAVAAHQVFVSDYSNSWWFSSVLFVRKSSAAKNTYSATLAASGAR
jgi:hypothetical protein